MLRSQLSSSSTVNDNGSSNAAINEPTALQKRVMELERLLAISHSHVTALKEKSVLESAALQVASVGVKRDLETASQQLSAAQETIRAQESLLHQCTSLSYYYCYYI